MDLKGWSKAVKVMFYYLTLNVKSPFKLIEVSLYLELSASFKLFQIGVVPCHSLNGKFISIAFKNMFFLHNKLHQSYKSFRNKNALKLLDIVFL